MIFAEKIWARLQRCTGWALERSRSYKRHSISEALSADSVLWRCPIAGTVTFQVLDQLHNGDTNLGVAVSAQHGGELLVHSVHHRGDHPESRRTFRAEDNKLRPAIGGVGDTVNVLGCLKVIDDLANGLLGDSQKRGQYS